MDFIIPPAYSTEDQLLIRRAYDHARKKHSAEKRESGEPYIVHPMAVAEILMQLPAKAEVVAVGLLHDVLENTDESFAELKEVFGFEVAKLVNVVTKTKRLERIRKDHPEDERKILHHQFLDTIKDIRSAVVKVADRLHNCRTLEHLPPQKQFEIAEETVKLYVPLARQIGLSLIERELAVICLDILPKWDYQAATAESFKYEQEIVIKGYHQNKLDLCLL